MRATVFCFEPWEGRPPCRPTNHVDGYYETPALNRLAQLDVPARAFPLNNGRGRPFYNPASGENIAITLARPRLRLGVASVG
jgi:hypothetical protein